MKKTNTKIEDNFCKEDFKACIKTAEKSPKMSLEKFNEKWSKKELEIKKLFQK